jgi:hypothetical protein
MFCVEDDCPLTEEHCKFLEYVLEAEFPWFFHKDLDASGNIMHLFVHNLMLRNPRLEPVEGIVNSPFYDICLEIFENFCNAHKIQVNTIFRAALNSTFYNTNGQSRIHTDHNFEHKNFILYINEFRNGQTCIFDEQGTLQKKVEPRLYKAVAFSGDPHAHNYCAPNERRVILVITFN